jgi:hypothetical protein
LHDSYSTLYLSGYSANQNGSVPGFYEKDSSSSKIIKTPATITTTTIIKTTNTKTIAATISYSTTLQPTPNNCSKNPKDMINLLAIPVFVYLSEAVFSLS